MYLIKRFGKIHSVLPKTIWANTEAAGVAKAKWRQMRIVKTSGSFAKPIIGVKKLWIIGTMPVISDVSSDKSGKDEATVSKTSHEMLLTAKRKSIKGFPSIFIIIMRIKAGPQVPIFAKTALITQLDRKPGITRQTNTRQK